MRRRRGRDLRGTHYHHIRRPRPPERRRRPGHEVRPRNGDCRSPRRRTTTRTHTANRGRRHVRISVRQTPSLRVRVAHHYIHRPRRMRRRRGRDLRGTHYHHIRRPRPPERRRRPPPQIPPRDSHCRPPPHLAPPPPGGPRLFRPALHTPPCLWSRLPPHPFPPPPRMPRRRGRDLRGPHSHPIRRPRPPERRRPPRPEVRPRNGDCRSPRRRT